MKVGVSRDREVHGFARGTSSGRGIHSEAMRRAFELVEGEQAICCITLGTAAKRKPPHEQPAPDDFVSWF